MPENVDATRRLLAISCAEALELMTDHLDGALSDGDASRMRAHLEGCEACQVFLDQLRATIAVVQSAGTAEEFPVEPGRMDALVKLFLTERGD